MAENTQLAQLNSVKSLIEASKGAIASRLPKHVTVDRITRVALTAVNKNPELLECSRDSLMLSIMQAAELGLEPGGALGEGYLIPFNNKVKVKGVEVWVKQAQFIPGYRGLISLARRSGQILSIEAHVVHDGDKFECCFGLDPRLEHTPDWDADGSGALKFVYAVAKLKDGGTQFEVMSKAAVEAIRLRSKAGNGSPWKTDYEEMARKTVIRRLFKYLPVSVEMAQALDIQAGAEAGEFVGTTISGDALTIDADVLSEATVANASKSLKETIKAVATIPPSAETVADVASATPEDDDF